MPEVNYAPDPRPDNTAQQSRNYGPGRQEVLINKAPAAPPNRARPAINYTSGGSGSFSIWDTIAGVWRNFTLTP